MSDNKIKINNIDFVGVVFVIGCFLVIILCIGELDLLDAIIKWLMSKST